MLADAIRLLLFPALMAFAASSDLFTMTISNRVTLILVAGFFALALFTGMNLDAVLSHSAAALAVLAVTFTFFAQGWIGGGDAKLAAATALWLGFDHLMPYLLYASIFGGVLTLAMIRFRLMPLPAAARRAGLGEAPAQARRRRALWHRARSRGAADLSRHPWMQPG